ncbi:hypothetical protein [Paracoccus jiaweipingae]|uniref:hypothetical protein n=1 Tax=unclassified Paracoccus (in: a-proteobacteria) TaxID=2688777 RepID=UPI0037AE4774
MPPRWTDPLPRIAGLALTVGLLAAPVRAEPPLVASDWLSGSLAVPRESSAWRPGDGVPADARPPGPRPQAVARSGAAGDVLVTRLGAGDPDATGTVPPRKLGLPADLWGRTPAPDLARAIAATDPRLPVLRGLLRQLLLTQFRAAPVSDLADQGKLHLARVDGLLDMAALAQARALIEVAGTPDADRFRRLFDIALIEGREQQACKMMDATPGIAPSFQARVYCLAMGGDWAAASTVFYAADALGLIDRQMAPLLAHFLDDSLVDQPGSLTAPRPVTPLAFRILEAIGQPLPTTGLPLAMAHADLRANGGWKARLEAAERLARVGALEAATLRAIYTEQKPAASGGVWDRAAALQALDLALTGGDPDRIATALAEASAHFASAGLADALAAMIAPDLPPALTGTGTATGTGGDSGAPDDAAMLRLWAGLPVTPTDAALAELAVMAAHRRLPPRADPPPTPSLLPEALAEGLTDAARDAAQPDPDQRGAALLAAISDTDAALAGDLTRGARGLAVLRALGLEEQAWLAAVQIALWPRLSPDGRP